MEAPEPTATARLTDGVVAPLRRYGKPDGPRLLINHGNGLAIDLFHPF